MRSTLRPAKRGSDPAVAEKMHSATAVHFRMHPRVFAALGADLVTSDVVAVVELVKNSYDAYANRVWVRLGTEDGEPYLEIEDDGQGMTRDVITDVWCVVATPHKINNPNIDRNGAMRRVSGAKGLGRLSVGRLGERLTLLTKAEDHPCWQVEVNWTDLIAQENLNDSTIELRRRLRNPLRRKSGTLLRILSLRSQWDEERCEELKDNLGRLISPFKGAEDFRIHFATKTDEGKETEIRISTPKFLSKPKYWIRGEADDQGNVTAQYRYQAINTPDRRKRDITIPWDRIKRSRPFYGSTYNRRSRDSASCGPFSFDIRAWDIAASDTQEIEYKYGLQRQRIREAIRAHKGLSVYRDGVLVLPKSEAGHDWLRLDLRRVSKVGLRMSTNQLVGYVSITADGNPGIQDTSDRERLALSNEVRDFQHILEAIVGKLEEQRDQDRAKDAKETPMKDLLGDVSAQAAIEDVRALARSDQPASRAIPILRHLDSSLSKTRRNIERRFVYYSRLATVGTVAQMLVHEILNRTTAISRFLDLFKEESKKELRNMLDTSFKMASDSVESLERLADVFAPLSRRSFKRSGRTAFLEERIGACLLLQRRELRHGKIRCSVPDTRTMVAIDPGELDAVILNLITNSIYWLQELGVGRRRLEFQILRRTNSDRVLVRTTDTGPGIDSLDMERVFWPGVTHKPNGLGMGLTVASEVVAAYGGRMAAEDVDSGACFIFDLPLARVEGVP